MEHFVDRKAMVQNMLEDPDLTLTTKERFTYIYNWMRLEFAIIKRDRAHRNIEKYSILLEEDRKVFVLRTTLNDL